MDDLSYYGMEILIASSCYVKEIGVKLVAVVPFLHLELWAASDLF